MRIHPCMSLSISICVYVFLCVRDGKWCVFEACMRARENKNSKENADLRQHTHTLSFYIHISGRLKRHCVKMNRTKKKKLRRGIHISQFLKGVALTATTTMEPKEKKLKRKTRQQIYETKIYLPTKRRVVYSTSRERGNQLCDGL